MINPAILLEIVGRLMASEYLLRHVLFARLETLPKDVDPLVFIDRLRTRADDVLRMPVAEGWPPDVVDEANRMAAHHVQRLLDLLEQDYRRQGRPGLGEPGKG